MATWYRLLLRFVLVLVAVGVAWMHATGHFSCHHGCDSSASSSGVIAPVTVPHADAAMPDSHGKPAFPFDSGMDPVQVCMAILTELASAVLLLAAWRIGRRTTVRQWAIRRSRSLEVLPVFLPPGGSLSYIDLSVLRI